MATVSPAYGTWTSMTVTNLQSMANSQTAGWQSDRIDNQTSLKATNFEFLVKLTTANTAPANDKMAYVYAVPWIYDGATWYPADQGTATLPTGTQGASTIALPNNLKLIGALNYTTQNMTMEGYFQLCPSAAADAPDGVSIIIVNYTGAALSTGCVVAYRPINYTVV